MVITVTDDTKKEALLRVLHNAYSVDADYIALMVQTWEEDPIGENPVVEFSLHPAMEIINRRDHYLEDYDDDLMLISQPNTHIQAVAYFTGNTALDEMYTELIENPLKSTK